MNNDGYTNGVLPDFSVSLFYFSAAVDVTNCILIGLDVNDGNILLSYSYQWV